VVVKKKTCDGNSQVKNLQKTGIVTTDRFGCHYNTQYEIKQFKEKPELIMS
jgi:hypothetical protein